MLCFPTLRITLLCKKVFGAAIPMDYIFEFPLVTFFFVSQTQLLDQKLISERLCKSQNVFFLVL
jgi:hypothetical protein